MTHQDPITLFFGLSTDASAIALLGLDPDRLTDDDILVARSNRLEQIDAHPLSATPDADEARLAIHSAAAQLIQLSARSRSQRHTGSATSQPLPRPKPRLGVSRAAALLERDTLILVGLSGGWSPKVLTRLASIAIIRGLTAKDAVAAANRLAHRPARPSQAARTIPTNTTSAPRNISKQRIAKVSRQQRPQPVMATAIHDEIVLENWLKTAMVVGSSVGLTLAILILGAIWAFSTLGSSSSKDETTPAQIASKTPSTPDRVSPPRDNVNNSDLVLYELTAAQTLLQTNRSLQAVDRIRSALDHWLVQWPNHAPERWRMVLQKLVPMIESIRQDPAGDQRLAALFAAELPPNGEPVSESDVPKVVAIAAVLGSLDRTKPTRLSNTWLSFSLAQLPEGATPAAKLALQDLARSKVVNSAPAYTAWADSVTALATILVENPTPMLIEGATELLGRLDPPTPGEQQAIEAIITRLDWRSGSAARAWILERLNDRTVHPYRVSVALNTLATNSSAPGITTSHRLKPAATWADRKTMSKSLAQVWELKLSLDSDLYLEDWLARADELLAGSPPQSIAEKIELLGNLAYLNSSAMLSLSGHDDAAVSNLSRTQLPIPLFEPLSPLFNSTQDSELTLAAESRNTDELLDSLSHLNRSSDEISRADAVTLVNLAFQSRNEIVRTAATDALRSIAASPPIILAAIKASPLISDTAPNRSLLAVIASDTVIPAPEEDWHDTVHRVLANALLARTTSKAASLDNTVQRIHRAYASAARITPIAQNARLDQHARAQTSHQLSAIHPNLGFRPVTTPEQIASLRNTRLRVAQGPIQRFSIEQFALVGAVAVNASSNNHAFEGPIQSLWASMQRDRLTAPTAIDQALTTERTLAHIQSLLLASRNSPRQPRRSTPSSKPHSTLNPKPGSGVNASLAAQDDPREDLALRMQRLSPDQPAAYLALGEELASIGRDKLAVHAFVLAAAQGAYRADFPTAASACLALISHTQNQADRDLLRALADTLNPRLSQPAWLSPDQSASNHNASSLKAARLLLDLRRGRGDQALEALRDPEIRSVLEQQPELATIAALQSSTTLTMIAEHARAWPCPECDNDRTIKPRGQTQSHLCPHCHGAPGPKLSDQEQIAWLTVEVRLLSLDTPWSTALVFPGQNAPVTEPSLENIPRMFGVDASETLYRNGQWATP